MAVATKLTKGGRRRGRKAPVKPVLDSAALTQARVPVPPPEQAVPLRSPPIAARSSTGAIERAKPPERATPKPSRKPISAPVVRPATPPPTATTERLSLRPSRREPLISIIPGHRASLIPRKPKSKPSPRASQELDLASLGATQILQAAVRDDVTIKELADLAQMDPAFAMRLLAMVNSAAYRGACNVTEISRAISLLGIRGTRTVALGMVVADLAPLSDQGGTLLANCIRRAIASRLLGEALGDEKGDDYFTVGLLLDAGLLTEGEEALAQALDVSTTPAADRVVRERAAGRDPHTDLGAALAKRYNLPGAVQRAIRAHHAREIPDEPLAAVAWTAERVAGVFEGGEVALNKERAYDAGMRLGLDDYDVDQVLEALPKQVADAAQAFRAGLGAEQSADALANDARHQLVGMTRHYVELIQTLEAVLEEKETLARQLSAANQSLKELAATDPLTQLPNRRGFREAITELLLVASTQRTQLCIVMLDIDHFKSFNDTYGHATGDDVLKAVAETLQRASRPEDIAARLGGEEFAVILPNTDALAARGVTERLRTAIEKHRVGTEHGFLSVTASFGIASLKHGEFRGDPDEMLNRADVALYQAKETGRNRVVVDGASPLASERA